MEEAEKWVAVSCHRRMADDRVSSMRGRADEAGGQRRRVLGNPPGPGGAGDMARWEEQVSLREVDAATHEELLAEQEQIFAASIDEIRGVGNDVVARVQNEALAEGAEMA